MDSNGKTNASDTKVMILTVHGTGDGSLGPIGQAKWWEQNSVFLKDVDERLKTAGIEAVHHYANWDGKNSERSRRKAARDLAKQIQILTEQKLPIHIVAHSHGGNIAEEAINIVDRKPRFRNRNFRAVKSVTTVGTPFFRRTLSFLRRIQGIFFITCLLGSLSLSILIWVGKVKVEFKGLSLDIPDYVVLILFAVAAVVTSFLLYRSTIKGIFNGKIRAPRDARWRAIMHDGDEVMSAFRIDRKMISITPQGTLKRLARWTWDSAVLLGLFGALATYLTSFFMSEDHNLEILILIWMAFPLAYVLAMIFSWIFEQPFRRFIDSRFFATVRNAAYGADTEHTLASVDILPSRFKAEEVELSLKTSIEMRRDASEHLAELIVENYDNFFDITSQFDARRISLLLDNEKLWRSLIHCRYFEYTEISQLIAENIVSHSWEPNEDVEQEDLKKTRLNAINRMRTSYTTTKLRRLTDNDRGFL